MSHIQEEWKDIPGFNGRYQASTLGRIKAIGHPRRINHTFVMKPQPRGAGGYLGVCLYSPYSGKPKSHFIQVIVAATFLGPKPPSAQVNHKDLNKHNNAVANLEYTTGRDNTAHALRNGAKMKSGTGNCSSPAEVAAIRMLLSRGGMSQRAIARMFGKSHAAVGAIARGTAWRCLPNQTTNPADP